MTRRNAEDVWLRRAGDRGVDGLPYQGAAKQFPRRHFSDAAGALVAAAFSRARWPSIIGSIATQPASTAARSSTNTARPRMPVHIE